jgi:hypothetical protein
MPNNKFIVVVDRNCSMTQIVNAVGHLSLGLGHHSSTSSADYSIFNNNEVGDVSYLTDYPLIILGAKSSLQLFNLHQSILNGSVSIAHNVFFENMFSHSVQEQLSQIKNEKISELKYIAIMMYGEDAEISGFVKKFSLLRDS